MKKAILVVVVIVVIAIIGFVAYRYYYQSPNYNQPTTQTNQQTQTNTPADQNQNTNSVVNTNIQINAQPIPSVQQPPQATVKTFNITGANLAFSMKEIKVKQGDRVKINFTSNGGTHNWAIGEFNAQTKLVNTGELASVEFVASQKGNFEFYCTPHRSLGMVGRLIVE